MDTFPKSFGIVLYPGFEPLDATGPIEVINCLAHLTQDPDLKLSVIGRSMEPVSVGKSAVTSVQKYVPSHTFADAPQLDMLIVPGGIGSINFLPGTEQNDVDDYIDFVKRAYHGYDDRRPLRYIMSVCNGEILELRVNVRF
jgi:putative intracellular protease/amidase